MTEVRELAPADTAQGAAALLVLRPAYGDAEAIAARADALRASGYRLAGSFEPGEAEAAAVAGFRVAENLPWGRHLYVDDLVTRPERRGRGHGGALMRWLQEEARRNGCGALHLDSSVAPERAVAHRMYFGCGMRISSFHFSRELGE